MAIFRFCRREIITYLSLNGDESQGIQNDGRRIFFIKNLIIKFNRGIDESVERQLEKVIHNQNDNFFICISLV